MRWVFKLPLRLRSGIGLSSPAYQSRRQGEGVMHVIE
jgi:hypothetical protein